MYETHVPSCYRCSCTFPGSLLKIKTLTLEKLQQNRSNTNLRLSGNATDLYTLRRPAPAAAVVEERTKQGHDKKAISPQNLPKLLTKDLDLMASIASREATRGAEDHYLRPSNDLHHAASFSARPYKRSRSIDNLRMPQSATSRSRSRARHANPLPTMEESPLGISGLPFVDFSNQKMFHSIKK